MYWTKKHVLVCNASHCTQKGANDVAMQLRREVLKRGLDSQILVNNCGTIDLCDIGPNIVVYPEGVIYSGVQVSDLKDIIGHLEGGEPVERLILSAETPAEIEREQFYRSVVAEGDSLPAERFEELAATRGFDAAWIAEQARRGFVARKEVDGVPVIIVTSKALQRYRIAVADDTAQA